MGNISHANKNICTEVSTASKLLEEFGIQQEKI